MPSHWGKYTSLCSSAYNCGEIRSVPFFSCGPGSSAGIPTDYGLDGPGSNPGGDKIFCPPSLLYNGYQVFPGGKVQPGRATDHSPPSSAAVMEE